MILVKKNKKQKKTMVTTQSLSELLGDFSTILSSRNKNGKVFPPAAALYRRHLQLLSPHQDQLKTDAGAQKKRSHGHGPSDAKCSIHPSLTISPEIRTESRSATPAVGSATVPALLA